MPDRSEMLSLGGMFGVGLQIGYASRQCRLLVSFAQSTNSAAGVRDTDRRAQETGFRRLRQEFDHVNGGAEGRLEVVAIS